MKNGRAMIGSGQFAPAHISELASAIATLELVHGNRPAARKLFRTALIDPTENSVAQAAWAAREAKASGVDAAVLDLPRTFEARAWDLYGRHNWSGAIAEVDLWLLDEPFASRPAVFGSFAAAVALGDFESGANFAKRGLIANPAEFLLLNNLAFSLASQGHVTDAQSVLSRVDITDLDAGEKVAFLATSGLLRFRSGDHDAGRMLYLKAADWALRNGFVNEEGWARVFLAREELAGRSGKVADALARAARTVKRMRGPDAVIATGMLQQLAAIGAAIPAASTSSASPPV